MWKKNSDDLTPVRARVKLPIICLEEKTREFAEADVTGFEGSGWPKTADLDDASGRAPFA